jgi:hypothetical protein
MKAYAMEELVAELGSAFLPADLDLALEPRADHAAYIESWLKVLKSDKRAIFSAASHAQRAADYLKGKSLSFETDENPHCRPASHQRAGRWRDQDYRHPRLDVGIFDVILAITVHCPVLNGKTKGMGRGSFEPHVIATLHLLCCLPRGDYRKTERLQHLALLLL